MLKTNLSLCSSYFFAKFVFYYFRSSDKVWRNKAEKYTRSAGNQVLCFVLFFPRKLLVFLWNGLIGVSLLLLLVWHAKQETCKKHDQLGLIIILSSLLKNTINNYSRNNTNDFWKLILLASSFHLIWFNSSHVKKECLQILIYQKITLKASTLL